MFFYTDGLVERPGSPIRKALAELCDVVWPGPPERVCTAVMDAFVGTGPAFDDVAALALRRAPADG